MGRGATARAAHRQERRGRRLGPRRPRRGAAADPRRPSRGRVRARRPHRRACCATASPSSRWRSASSSGGSTRCAPRAPSFAPASRSASTSRSTSSTRSSTRSCSAAGATAWRDLPIPGRELGGIHQAMEFLPLSNRVQEGDLDAPPITAEGKHVVIIGGGDTGADCLGTVHRQGAAAVHQFEILPRSPDDARSDEPVAAVVDGVPHVVGARGGRRARLQREHRVLPRRRRRQRARAARRTRSRCATDASRRSTAPTSSCRASSCCSRWASSGPSAGRCSISSASSSTVAATSTATPDFQTSVEGVFACGDMGRGQSLIVWAIAEGRSCAASVDRWLTGDTTLPVADPADDPSPRLTQPAAVGAQWETSASASR